MLAIIRNDHINMKRLLKILTNKIVLLEKDETVDFRLVKTIITYLRHYADRFHHPMEDLIWAYYRKHYRVSSDIAARLPLEHKRVKQATIELDELLEMILLDAIVPKEQCIEKLKYFVALQSAHMAYEEEQILPLIEESLSDNDWENIRQQWQYNEYKDPLFGESVADQYRKLATYLK